MIFSRKNIAYAIVFAGLLAQMSCGLLAMVPEQRGLDRLYFCLNGNRIIESCLEGGSMKFALPEQDFLGHDIVDVLPAEERNDVIYGFDRARDEHKTTFISYNLKDENYTALILPLFDLQGLKNYTVTVWKTEFAPEPQEQSSEFFREQDTGSMYDVD